MLKVFVGSLYDPCMILLVLICVRSKFKRTMCPTIIRTHVLSVRIFSRNKSLARLYKTK